ncbi:MAG: hypothetical protein Q8P63_01610 [Candidatus Nealsonbacteria bacterium]|nr:hypothetical protein [Candidatus Nealsonbacteria bacterium]
MLKRKKRKIREKRKIRWRQIFPIKKRRGERAKEILAKIQEREPASSKSQLLGLKREQKFLEALESLQKKGKIISFLKMAKFTQEDLLEGVDFYVVCVRENIYEFIPLGVTGGYWLEEDNIRHPKVLNIAVDEDESQESVEQKILVFIGQEYSYK